MIFTNYCQKLVIYFTETKIYEECKIEEQCTWKGAVCRKISENRKICFCDREHTVLNKDKSKCLLKGNIYDILENLFDIIIK